MSNLDEISVTNNNTTFRRVLAVPWITLYPTTHRGKLICLILCIIAAVLIILVGIYLTTVVLKKEVDLTTTTTPTTTATKNDIVRSTTTESEEDLNNANNTINIIQWRATDYRTRRTRHWYATEDEPIGDDWIRDSAIFRAYRTPENDTEPVYGYSFKALYGWHNTLQMDLVLETSDANRWMLSGVKFYAYNTSMGSEKLRPVRRYWSDVKTAQTSDEFGRTYKLMIDVESEEQAEWTFDKIVFYALLPKK